MGMMEEVGPRKNENLGNAAGHGSKDAPANPVDTEVELASEMAKYMLGSPKMAPAYQQAAGNPKALGLLAAQTVLGVRDKMIEKDLLTNDEIWAADDGVLPAAVDHIKGVLTSLGLKVSDEDSAAIYQGAIDTMAKFDQAGQESKKKQQGAGGMGAAGMAAQGGAPQQPPQGGGY